MTIMNKRNNDRKFFNFNINAPWTGVALALCGFSLALIALRMGPVSRQRELEYQCARYEGARYKQSLMPDEQGERVLKNSAKKIGQLTGIGSNSGGACDFFNNF